MKFYQAFLETKGIKVTYIEANEETADIRKLIARLIEQGVAEIHICEVTDNWIEKRIEKAVNQIKIVKYQTALFINSKTELTSYFQKRTPYFQTDFYIQQRKNRQILLDDKLKPVGGKWTFDAANRLKYPKSKTPPVIQFPEQNHFLKEAYAYVNVNFTANYGELSTEFIYPTTYDESKVWLNQFLQYRFTEFGAYEDALVTKAHILHHSVLTPMLNVGLLTPKQVIDATFAFAESNSVPINSLEGFIRQIIGWREFIRGVYEFAGTQERNRNFWQFHRKIPEPFWLGTTGIEPFDGVVKKVLRTGYCHHIERLMVLGNFMLLCEFDPDDVYRWFMTLFIDAYDWVMVPNVYGMSQFADGGLMATKPYISGSNYLLKMGDFAKGDWQTIWDGLFWRFMHVHRDFFLTNPRLGMLINNFDKMTIEKQQGHIKAAENYLAVLDKAQ